MDNATPTTEQTNASNSEPKDMRSEMLAFVENDASELEDGEGSEQTQDEENENSESKEEEKSEEDSSKEDEESDEEDKEKEPKKKNRYQKQKAKIESLTNSVKEVTSQRDKAVALALSYKHKLEAVVQKYKSDMEAFKSGKQLTEADQKLWLLEAKQKEREALEKLQKDQLSEKVKEDIQMEIAEQKAIYINEALSHAKRFGFSGEEAKSFARKILLYTATEHSNGREISLEEVANEFGQVYANKSKSSMMREQQKKNSSAPRTFSSKSGKVPSFELTHKDAEEDKKTMLAFLESQGKG